MSNNITIEPIAYIHNDFTTKFGIPRQSGLMSSLESKIIFEPKYRDENALRGMDGFDMLWLIWGFSEIKNDNWYPMVKPPRLGGNTRMGVFATRSPNRPNHLGLSCVTIKKIEKIQGYGLVIYVTGADLMDGSPIYDIKPYVPYADAHPDVRGGFAHEHLDDTLTVKIENALLKMLPKEKQTPLIEALQQDPRPAYIKKTDTPFSFPYAGYEIRFTVKEKELTVYEIVPEENASHVK